MKNLTAKQKQDFYNFIQNYSADGLVELQQNYMKDHYLSEPEVDLDYLFHEFEMWELIQDKYRWWFASIGIEATYKWLNPFIDEKYSACIRKENFPMRWINWELGITEDELAEDDLMECTEAFNELYGESFSGWGYSALMNELFMRWEQSSWLLK